MSDQEKNIKDEDLDNVSGGTGITAPHEVIRNPVTGPHAESGSQTSADRPVKIDPV
jgi:hypothetical protein